MDTNCFYCSQDNTTQVESETVVDTYGGDYTYQSVYRCNNCTKHYYVFSGSNPCRFEHFDRSISEE